MGVFFCANKRGDNMGGRGASLGSFNSEKSNHFFAVHEDGSRAKITEYKFFENKGLFYAREEGSSEWMSPMTREQALRDAKNAVKATLVDPKKLDKYKKHVAKIEKKNAEKWRKEDIKDRLKRMKNGEKFYANQARVSRADRGYNTYKGGKRDVRSEYIKYSVSQKLAETKGDLESLDG